MKKAGMMILALAIGTVCSAEAAPSEDFQKAVDEYAQITLGMDEESALVDAAYESVAAYLEEQEEELLENAAEEVGDTLSFISEKYRSCIRNPYQIPEEMYDILDACGIYAEDLQAFASEEEMILEQYVTSLSGINEYLSYEQTDLPETEELKFYYEMVSKTQEIQRYYMYTGINYWFADCSEEELDYVDEAVTRKLESFCSDGHEWDTSQTDVEDRLNAYLDEIADLRLDWEIHLGQQEAEINRMKREMEELKKNISEETQNADIE